jgi:O-glycosyl hydrolase
MDLSDERFTKNPRLAKLIFDKYISYQKIDGFGAFGLRDVNWVDATEWWTDEWGEMVINDLGLTITRNEWYPPKIEGEVQDTTWEIQKPYIQKLHAMAKKYNKPLKQVVAIWSPPAHMKENQSAKWGGKLLPECYDDFGYWLVECLDAYKEAGIDVYALSPQNEPIAEVPYNSAFYTAQEYVDMIKVAIPIVKHHYPKVKIMAPESLIWESMDWNATIEKALMDDREAFALVDIFAVHLYTWDYQYTASDPDQEVRELENYYNKLKKARKELWQSEVCGWEESWDGAFSMGESILNCLYSGNMSAWLYWTLSSGSLEYQSFTIMTERQPGEKFNVAKHFYKYIRPGSRRIETFSTDSDIKAVGFLKKGKLTFIIMNIGTEPCKVVLDDSYPEGKGDRYSRRHGNKDNGFNVILSDKDNKCVELDSLGPDQKEIIVPPMSIITLQGK